jgi:hypothetical protein
MLGWGKMHTELLHNLKLSPTVIRRLYSGGRGELGFWQLWKVLNLVLTSE